MNEVKKWVQNFCGTEAELDDSKLKHLKECLQRQVNFELKDSSCELTITLPKEFCEGIVKISGLNGAENHGLLASSAVQLFASVAYGTEQASTAPRYRSEAIEASEAIKAIELGKSDHLKVFVPVIPDTEKEGHLLIWMRVETRQVMHGTLPEDKEETGSVLEQLVGVSKRFELGASHTAFSKLGFQHPTSPFFKIVISHQRHQRALFHVSIR